MPNAARVLDAARDPDPHGITGARRRMKVGVQLDARHAEVEALEELRPRLAEGVVEIFFSRFEPFEKTRKPHDTRRVAVAPMDGPSHPEKTHSRSIGLCINREP